VVAGTLRVPLSQPQKRHIQPGRYVPFLLIEKYILIKYLKNDNIKL